MTTDETPCGPAGGTTPVRPRDAGRTRAALLGAGLARFAGEGYAGTSVRQVGSDAAVDPSLIKRYFGSKEGLFEACLGAAVDALRDTVRAGTTQDVARRLARHAVSGGPDPDGAPDTAGRYALLLLLRSSGDENVDALRRRVLLQQSNDLTRTLLRIAGRPRATPSEGELLRAQVVLAAAVGIAVLRASPGLEPLRTAAAEEFTGSLHELVRAVVPDAT